MCRLDLLMTWALADWCEQLRLQLFFLSFPLGRYQLSLGCLLLEDSPHMRGGASLDVF